MAHTTIGFNINRYSIHYAVCNVAALNAPIDILAQGCLDRTAQTDDATDGLDLALKELVSIINQYKKMQVDAIGLVVDPTLTLSTHRLLPFNDHKQVEKILPLTLADDWKIDDTTQISFEIGDYVEGNTTEGEETESGYNVHAIAYPRDVLQNVIDRLNANAVDPHVILPESEVLNYAFKTIIAEPSHCWILLNIGEETSMLSVIVEGRVALSRAFKLGINAIEQAIEQAFETTPQRACEIKNCHGFVAVPGTEALLYEDLTQTQRIQPVQDGIDPVALAGACAHGLEMLMTAIRQTLTRFMAQTHIEPECLCLCGDGAHLPGIDAWFSECFDVQCSLGVPLCAPLQQKLHASTTLDLTPLATAVAAAANVDAACPLNLRHSTLAHKGSWAYLQDRKWWIASTVLLLIISLITLNTTKASTIQLEHDALKAALEDASSNVFGKKLLTYKQIEDEIAASNGFDFIPIRTAFTHFAWISNNVNDNMADVEMDLNALDIDTQRKIVTIRGEITGDEGLPRFMQLLEQYECFPNEIQEPKTTKSGGRTSFTLRIDANHCPMGGDSE